jgi:hypothetical protein
MAITWSILDLIAFGKAKYVKDIPDMWRELWPK